MFARKRRISPHPQLFQYESACGANQHNEQSVIAHFCRKRVIDARGDRIPLRTPTKGASGKLYWKISALVILSCQELSVRVPSAAA
jgi:hypothetical protein